MNQQINHYFNEQDIREWWLVAHNETLDEGKTVRAVAFTPSGTFTLKKSIRSIDELMKLIRNGYTQYGEEYGISVSAAEFEIAEGHAPSSETFISTDTIAIDIDVYAENSKNRVNLANLEKPWAKFIALIGHTSIYSTMSAAGIEMPTPIMIGVTGGGVQLIYKFDSAIRAQTAEKIFHLLKKHVPQKRYKTFVRNPLGSLAKVDLEYDTTSFDKQHVQRVLGTLNPKYKTLSYIIRDFDKKTSSLWIKNLLLETISQLHDDITKNSLFKYSESITPIVAQALDQNINEKFNVKTLLEEAKLESSSPIYNRKGLTNIEMAILTQLNGGKGIDLLLRDKIEIVKENHKICAIKCPFHEGDEHYSFAIYKNGDTPTGIDVFLDFHDQQKYNLIEFYAKLMGISKADAIREIVDLTGIKIAKAEKKELKHLEAREESTQLIDKVDTENYIYYRMANKQKNCIIRHINSGKSYVFDGLKSLVRQVLKDQLEIDEVSREFLDEFTEIFESKILIDGFENFAPGREPVFKENGISLINMWVPTTNYKKAKKRADELLEERDGRMYTLSEAIEEIKERCPYTRAFIYQIVQYGSVEWFINWLAMTAQFKITPTIPFHYGNYGTGKNLFVNTVLEWYLNSEYVHIVGSDEITKQFNAFLQQSSLVVIDESNLYDSKSVDTLKMLSGNRKIKIEKKGIDTFDVERRFNFMTFSNREVPAYINTQERRFTFFYTSIPLTATVNILGKDIDEFTSKVENELETFYGILLNTVTEKKWENMNIKDGTFYRVMFSGHSFGRLVLTILDNSWDSLVLQLTENASDEGTMASVMSMVDELRMIFEKEGKLPLALVNRYMDSLNYKNKSSVADFVRQNNLNKFIRTKVGAKGIMIELEVAELRKLIETRNVLLDLYQEMYPGIEGLEDLENECITNIDCVIDFMDNLENSEPVIKKESFEFENKTDEIIPGCAQQEKNSQNSSPPTGNMKSPPMSLIIDNQISTAQQPPITDFNPPPITPIISSPISDTASSTQPPI